MYLRTTKVKRANGRVDEYIRLVESYWNQGSPRHRVICNMGRKDLLAPHAEALLCLLKGEKRRPGKEVRAVGAWDWGPLLVANRLTQPTSEHGLARWLETDFVCDRRGQRWRPEWREEAERLRSRRPRVRVKDGQLKKWYRTLDRLIGAKAQIEKELF